MAESRPTADISDLVLRGVRWKFVSQIVVQITRLAAGLVIARALAPREYGLAAMAVAFSGFVLVFSDLALGAALVQRRRISEQDRSTAFWTTIATGLVFSLLAIAVAQPIAAFYGEPRVRMLLMAFAPIFFISSLGATHQALLTRDMNFRTLEVRQMVSSLAGAVVGVTAALYGAGPWAIILQQLSIVATSSFVLWILHRWRPRFVFSRASLHDLFGFSASVFGTRVLYYTSENASSLLIGRFLGPAALGSYALAYHVILVPLLRIAVPIGEVLFPAFARMQDDVARLAKFWLRALRLLAALCMPGLIGFVIVAPDFIPLVLGRKWESAVPVAQILAWVGLLQALDAWNSGILMGLGHAKTQFRLAILFYSSFIASYAIGLHWGVVGVAASYAIAITAMQGIYQLATARVLGISVFAPVRAVSGVAQATAVLAIALLCAREVVAGGSNRSLPVLGFQILLGVVLYVPLCNWREPRVRAELAALWAERTGRTRAPAPPLAA